MREAAMRGRRNMARFKSSREKRAFDVMRAIKTRARCYRQYVQPWRYCHCRYDDIIARLRHGITDDTPMSVMPLLITRLR